MYCRLNGGDRWLLPADFFGIFLSRQKGLLNFLFSPLFPLGGPHMLLRAFFSISFFFTSFFGFPAYGADLNEAPLIEPRPETLLQEMTEYLNSLEQFTFQTDATEDRILASGQKLQFARTVEVSIRRPNRFRADVKGDLENQQLFYDGRTITLLDTNHNFYGTIQAPATINAALDYALESFSLRAPLADLVGRDSFDLLTEHVTSSFYVGLHDADGVKCHHLAFRQDDIDWQVWIEDSKTPLLRKVIITQKRVTGAPQFTAVLSDWNVAPKLADRLFTFIVPENAKKIEFLPME
jgi:hypothetical protein